jgi:cytochrome oxidase assembly protein ShyY1
VVYRFLLTRRWLGLLAVAVLVAASCLLLGRWQLHRYESKHERNAQVTANTHAPAARPGQLLRVGHGPADKDLWRRVRTLGRYDPDHTLLVRNRPYEGEVGFHVLVPLRTSAGPALLVDRGWVAAGENATVVPTVPRVPPGEVAVTVRVRASEPPSTTGTPPRGQVTRIDVSEIRKELPYPAYGGYGELIREQPRPRSAPALLPLPDLNTGPHLAYAVQWVLFALMALGGYVVLARREAADRRAVVEGRAPVVGVRVTG